VKLISGIRATMLPMTRKLCLAQDPASDELLTKDPFALLVGMLLDQHTA